jgi:hypothetical protein
MASSDSLPGTTPKSFAAEDKSPTDTQQSSAGSAQAKGNGNYWQVFLLLSLVVNIYLGILINKLLTRYRSLLANVRSQTA